MSRPIGYYVHHHGSGHRHRARLIAKALSRPCTLIGTFGGAVGDVEGFPVLDLPDDRKAGAIEFSGGGRDEKMPEAFHYAPVDVVGVSRRMSMLATWIEKKNPALIVTDVSVEIALFARLMGIRTAVMRLAGPRTDVPHLEAFRSAASILTPFPPAFESPETPRWVRDKTFYGGFLAPPAKTVTPSTEVRRVVVVLGSGGTSLAGSALASAANATPHIDWHVYGTALADAGPAPNLTLHGWRPNIAKELSEADVVIGGAGDGLLAEVATRGKRFICLPEDRPFDEQVDKARTLARLGLAVVLDGWPAPEGWPGVFRQVGSLDTERLRALADPNAVAALAAKIEAVAAGG